MNTPGLAERLTGGEWAPSPIAGAGGQVSVYCRAATSAIRGGGIATVKVLPAPSSLDT